MQNEQHDDAPDWISLFLEEDNNQLENNKNGLKKLNLQVFIDTNFPDSSSILRKKYLSSRTNYDSNITKTLQNTLHDEFLALYNDGGSFFEYYDQRKRKLRPKELTRLHLDSIATFFVNRFSDTIDEIFRINSGPAFVVITTEWHEYFNNHIRRAFASKIGPFFHGRNNVLVDLDFEIVTCEKKNNQVKQKERGTHQNLLGYLENGDACWSLVSSALPIPPLFTSFITQTIAIKPFDRQLLIDFCEYSFNASCIWDIPDEEWIRFVSPQDIAVLCGVEPSAFIERLKQQVERRLVSYRPSQNALSLDDMCGVGAAKKWASQLIADIKSFRAGEIEWSAVDRGALLEGPPGTGKTSLARAIAAEGGIPVVAVSASEWVGAGYLSDTIAAIKESFQKASELSPCVLFIDEIDSLGRRDEKTQHDRWTTWIVNMVLTCMDGFSSDKKVIVIGATNHADKLDPALMRSGRLDRIIRMELPTRKDLAAMFAHYLKPHTQHLTDAELDELAGTIKGRTGADVERIVRDASRAGRKEQSPITVKHLLRAIYETPDEDLRRHHSPEIQRSIATHEIGHALLISLAADRGESLAYCTIISSGHMLGYVSRTRSDEVIFHTTPERRHELAIKMAGRAAEEVFFGRDNISSGAQSDLKNATRIAKDMVRGTGLAPSGRLTSSKSLGKAGKKEVEDLLQDAYKHALTMVTEHRAVMEVAIETLIEKSEMSGAELLKILRPIL